jgi:hypothetical protein
LRRQAAFFCKVKGGGAAAKSRSRRNALENQQCKSIVEEQVTLFALILVVDEQKDSPDG